MATAYEYNPFRSLGRVSLTAEEKSAGRLQLAALMAAHPIRVAAPSGIRARARLFSARMRMKAAAVVGTAVTLALSAGGVSYASENALPGDRLYAVKTQVMEPVMEHLAVSPEKKAEVQTALAVRRAIEAESLARQGKLDAETRQTLETGFLKHADEAAAQIAAVRVRGSSGRRSGGDEAQQPVAQQQPAVADAAKEQHVAEVAKQGAVPELTPAAVVAVRDDRAGEPRTDEADETGATELEDVKSDASAAGGRIATWFRRGSNSSNDTRGGSSFVLDDGTAAAAEEARVGDDAPKSDGAADGVAAHRADERASAAAVKARGRDAARAEETQRVQNDASKKAEELRASLASMLERHASALTEIAAEGGDDETLQFAKTVTKEVERARGGSGRRRDAAEGAQEADTSSADDPRRGGRSDGSATQDQNRSGDTSQSESRGGQSGGGRNGSRPGADSGTRSDSDARSDSGARSGSGTRSGSGNASGAEFWRSRSGQ